MALLLTVDLSVDGVGVSDFVTEFGITIDTNDVEVPATASRRFVSHVGGSQSGTIQVGFLHDEGANSLQELLYAAITEANGTGIVPFSGKVRDDSDWRYTGSFLVTSWGAGGEVWQLGKSSMTFPLVDMPARSASAS